MTDPGQELLDETRRALEHRLAVEQARGRAPSMVAAVGRGSGALWHAGRGLVEGRVPDDDVQYRIGSITKTLVAVLVLRLRDAGRLGLDDRLDAHLPGTPVGDVTVAQLLAHGAGLASETPPPWWERSAGDTRPEAADLFGARPRPHPPGHRFHYSNPGFALLGALVERLHGRAWNEVLADEVLAPLGMARTSYEPVAPHARGWAVHPWADVVTAEPAEDAGLMAPAGQLWSTTADLCRFARLLLAGDERVLAPDTVARMRMPSVPTDAAAWERGYGLGVQLLRSGERLLAGHTGSMPGFLATLWVDPDQDVAAVVMANATAGPAVSALAAELAGIVATREPRSPTAWAPTPDAADPALLELVGPWYWGPAAFVVRLRAGPELVLESVPAGGRGSRFRPLDGGDWVGLDGYYAGETLRVVRDDDGVVGHLDLGSFVFTRAPYEPVDVVPGATDPDGWHA